MSKGRKGVRDLVGALENPPDIRRNSREAALGPRGVERRPLDATQQYAGDLTRALSGTAPVDLGVPLPGVADEDETPPGEGFEELFQRSDFMLFGRSEEVEEGVVTPAKSPQAKLAARESVAPQELRERVVKLPRGV